MRTDRSWTTPLVIGVIMLTSGGWLINKGGEVGVAESRRLLAEVHRLLSDRFVDEVEPDELYQMAIDGMIEKLGDPYTDFLDSRDWENLRYSTTGNYGGLGVRIDPKDGWITVVQVLPNTPALRQGLEVGDRIMEVEGESAEDWSSEKAVSVLRGPKGTPVNITIGRVGVDRPLAFRIVRDEIQVQQAQGFMLTDGIGFVALRGFSRQAQEELVASIDTLIEAGARSLILDLRRNPGGLLEEGIQVTDLFLESGLEVVETRSRLADQNVTYRAPSGERYEGLPMIVLVNSLSASASEIVAGALQDHDRAALVGTTSYGKGSVQTLYRLSGDNHIKITTARWYTPAGRSITRKFDREEAMRNFVASAVAISGEPVVPQQVEEEREEFRTDGGRIVYGGGGITPDVNVQQDTLTTDEQELRRLATNAGSAPYNIVFRWSVDWAQTHRPEEGFVVTDAMRESVFQKFEEAGTGVDRALFNRSLHYIDYLIAGELSGAAFGEKAQLLSRARRDAQVEVAIDLLKEAESPAALLVIAKEAAEARAAERASGGGHE